MNVGGLPGYNIAADLHMEHLNHDANKLFEASEPESITRIGKVIGLLAEVTSNFDRDILTVSNSGHHKVASAKTIIVINELLNHACV